MSSLIVKGALVLARNENGSFEYLYDGAEVPANIPADEVERLTSEGFFVEVVDEPETDVDKMKVEELKAHAAANGIDLGDATKKDDILAKIKGV